MNELLINKLRERVLKTPDKIAIIDINNSEITFKDLWSRAYNISHFLKNKDIKIADKISLVFTKSIDYIIAMVGVMMTGSSFTPIDSNQPLKRIDYILEKVNPKLILTNEEIIVEIYSQYQVENNYNAYKINDILDKSDTKEEKDLPPEIDKHSLAYTIFTSGSTGQPKGVNISHSGLFNVIDEQIKLFGLDETSSTYFIYNISFDASLSDIWTSLLSGATLVLEKQFVFKGEKDLFDKFKKFNITHVDLPPSIFKFLNPNNAPESLKTLILGGEIINIQCIHSWIKCNKNIITVYGPTEATICTSMEKCDINWDKPYIGKPLSTVNYYIDINETNIGELLISGDCLAQGYLNDSKMNAEKFIYKDNVCYYKTGDLVKVHSDETNNKFEFLGRIDRQIKFKGNLICPEEIEFRLKNYQGLETNIKNCVVMSDDINLICFVESENAIPENLLKDFLEPYFSKAMIPSQWIFYKEFPLLANGKIDIKQLSQNHKVINKSPKGAPDSEYRIKSPEGTPVGIYPESETRGIIKTNKPIKKNRTEILINAFKKVLNIKEVDLNASFFDLGGNSFSLLSLIVECEKEGLKINPEDIYNFGSIKGMNFPPAPLLKKREEKTIFSTSLLLLKTEEKGLVDSSEKNRKLLKHDLIPLQENLNAGREGNAVWSVEKLNHEVNSLIKRFPENYQSKNDLLPSISREGLGVSSFITGSTGFLGSRVLNHLLKDTNAKIYCLVRDENKLKNIINLISDDNSYVKDACYEKRIIPVIGDISKPKFALDDKLFSDLQEKIDSIYHIAADVNHFKNYEQLKETNVESTLNILELMSKGKYKPLNYASTLSVFVDADPLPQLCLESDLLEHTNNVYGGYAQGKWVTEKLLQSAKDYGDISIFRLGLLTADYSKGFIPDFDWFNSFIKGLSELKSIPEMNDYDKLTFDFTPVDYAAKSIVISTIYHESKFSNYHITTGYKPSLDMLLKALEKNDIKIDIIPFKEWIEKIDTNNLSKFAMVTYLALKNINSHLVIFKTTNTSFDKTNSEKLEKKYGLNVPKISQETIDIFVKNLIG